MVDNVFFSHSPQLTVLYSKFFRTDLIEDNENKNNLYSLGRGHSYFKAY